MACCRKEIIGIVLVKELVQELLIGPSQDRVRPITELRMRSLPMLYADMALYDMLHLFETGRSHMALLARARNPHHHLTAAEAAGAFTEAPLDSKQPEQSAAECNGHPEHAEHMNGGMAEVLYAEVRLMAYAVPLAAGSLLPDGAAVKPHTCHGAQGL